ncbi:hypothetical protein EDD22DRAFT_949109 [Suillus occidentalis]|nr:hypothetical protein EDD22DRAFT_949109 [Suillus occidentalis]
MTPPPSSVNSNNALVSPQPGAEKFTHEKIFSSFFNALGTAMAELEQKLITLSATHTWSVSNSTVAVPGSDIKCKPDLVLSNDIKLKWGNIYVCTKLTYSQYKPAQRIMKAVDTQAYLLRSNQPWRHFAFILSFTNQYHKLWVLLYDHADGIVTPCIKIHHNPDSFIQIIAAVLFGSPKCTNIPDYRPHKNLPTCTNQSITISAEHVNEPLTALHEDPQELPTNNETELALPSDNNIKSTSPDSLESLFDSNLKFSKESIEELSASPPSSLTYSTPTPCAPQQGANTTFSSTPHPFHFPHTHKLPTEPCGLICVKDKIYTILKILFTTKGLVGHDTVCYLVSLDGEEYIIKDHWVQGGEEEVLNKINILKVMSGVSGVPELVDYWLVERSDNIVDHTRDYCHAENVTVMLYPPSFPLSP